MTKPKSPLGMTEEEFRTASVAELEARLDRDNDPNLELLRRPPEPGQTRYVELYPGYSECFECIGDGCCIVCNGEGLRGGKRCSYCNGPGRCTSCAGAGQIPGGPVDPGGTVGR